MSVRLSFRQVVDGETAHVESMDFQSMIEADGYLFHKFDTDMGFVLDTLNSGGYGVLPKKASQALLNAGFENEVRIQRIHPQR